MLVMQRAVSRGQQLQSPKPLPAQLGVDEKYTSCGVLTLVNDLGRGCVSKVLLGREKEPLTEYLCSFPLQQREQIHAVALDITMRSQGLATLASCHLVRAVADGRTPRSSGSSADNVGAT